MTQFTRRSALTLLGGVALAAPFVRRARADDAVLNLYSWATYFGENTMEDFQSKTGIAVSYDIYSSAEEMLAKMLAGQTGYDLVDMAGGSLPVANKANLFDKIDKTKLPSWKNLDPKVLTLLEDWDPNNDHGMPYVWGSVGFTYNLDMVNKLLPGADLTSLDVIFKPENAAKLESCGISIVDSPGDIVLMVMKYVGADPDNPTPEDFKKAEDAFKPIRKYIRTFDNSNYLNAIPNKELCAINDWSGDYATAKESAKEAGVDINLGYYVPNTGTPAWIDVLWHSLGCHNKENAYKFLEYMLQPEVIADCTNTTAMPMPIRRQIPSSSRKSSTTPPSIPTRPP